MSDPERTWEISGEQVFLPASEAVNPKFRVQGVGFRVRI